MKRFIRTLAGKTVLFTACILSACLLSICVLGAFAMLQEDSCFCTTVRIPRPGSRSRP